MISRILFKSFLSIWTLVFLGIGKGYTSTSDSQFWTSITAMLPASKQSPKLRYWLEIQNRVGEDMSQLSQLLIRPGIGYEVAPHLSAWLGYARIYTTAPFSNSPSDENRIWQQLLWSKAYTQIQATVRSRLEERFINTNLHTGWRFRQMFKIAYTLPRHDKHSLVVNNETFFHLNDFNHQNNQGYDQNRLFVGLGYKTSKQSTVEIGYLNQNIYRVNNQTYIGNNLLISLQLNAW